jgi:hypothetical protein
MVLMASQALWQDQYLDEFNSVFAGGHLRSEVSYSADSRDRAQGSMAQSDTSRVAHAERFCLFGVASSLAASRTSPKDRCFAIEGPSSPPPNQVSRE